MSSANVTAAVNREPVDLGQAEIDVLRAACSILRTSNAAEKAARTRSVALEWQQHFNEASACGVSCSPQQLLEQSTKGPSIPPARPARPTKPVLQSAGAMPKRKHAGKEGRISLLHALAHIELNAIDLAWDIIARFAIDETVPLDFISDWISVADDEARHFLLLCDRLSELGADYGDLPAHDGLWEAAQSTGHDLTARLAIVPLILEARGLDITPSLIRQMEDVGDEKSAAIFRIILRDEEGHVAVGAKWFRFLCAKEGREPAKTFQTLVQKHFRGPLKPPFNDMARARAGLTPDFYRTLSSAGT